jgi:hypothetical protein
MEKCYQLLKNGLFLLCFIGFSACGGEEAKKEESNKTVNNAPSPISSQLKKKLANANQELDYQITVDIDANQVTMEPESGLGNGIIISERVDLNGNGMEDLILHFSESCGKPGECPKGIYMNKGGGQYTRVYGPAYIFSYTILDEFTMANGHEWKNIKINHRPKKDKDRNVTEVPPSMLIFTAQSYKLRQ